jgi:hypothetical protein
MVHMHCLLMVACKEQESGICSISPLPASSARESYVTFVAVGLCHPPLLLPAVVLVRPYLAAYLSPACCVAAITSVPSAARPGPSSPSLSLCSAPLDKHCDSVSDTTAHRHRGRPASAALYVYKQLAANSLTPSSTALQLTVPHRQARHRRPTARAAAASSSKPNRYVLSTMEAPLHQFPFPVPPLPQPQDALLQQAVAARALMMAGKRAPLQATAAAGREQCPRCASRDTKFCYYNNYNTAQPRHFCRACRRYWTLGGSLRNVPVGGSTRKRQRPARPTRAMAAAATAATPTATTTACSPFAVSPATMLLQGAAGGGLLVSSLLLGSASASPLLALGTAPLLEGRLGFDLGLGEAAALAAADGAAGDLAHHHQPLTLGAGPLPWPAATILEGDRVETTTWKASADVFPFPPAAALWQELPPAVEAGGLHHGAPHLLL